LPNVPRCSRRPRSPVHKNSPCRISPLSLPPPRFDKRPFLTKALHWACGKPLGHARPSSRLRRVSCCPPLPRRASRVNRPSMLRRTRPPQERTCRALARASSVVLLPSGREGPAIRGEGAGRLLRSRFSTMGAPPGLENAEPRDVPSPRKTVGGLDEDRRVIVAGGVAVDAAAAFGGPMTGRAEQTTLVGSKHRAGSGSTWRGSRFRVPPQLRQRWPSRSRTAACELGPPLGRVRPGASLVGLTRPALPLVRLPMLGDLWAGDDLTARAKPGNHATPMVVQGTSQPPSRREMVTGVGSSWLCLRNRSRSFEEERRTVHQRPQADPFPAWHHVFTDR
jgi:hypothetical protein